MKYTLPRIEVLLRLNAQKQNKLTKERKQLLIQKKALRKV